MREMRGNMLAGDTGETAIKSDAFQTFMRKSAPALREIFPPDAIKLMQDVADDLQRSAKSVSGTRLPGGSNTAQDLMSLTMHSAKSPSVIAQMVAAEAAAMALGAPGIGSVLPIGSLVLSVARKVGFQKVDDLVAQAMLDPAKGRAALLAPLPNNQTNAAKILTQRLRAVALVGGATAGRDERAAQ
jgi:hypothetical protein